MVENDWTMIDDYDPGKNRGEFDSMSNQQTTKNSLIFDMIQEIKVKQLNLDQLVTENQVTLNQLKQNQENLESKLSQTTAINYEISQQLKFFSEMIKTSEKSIDDKFFQIRQEFTNLIQSRTSEISNLLSEVKLSVDGLELMKKSFDVFYESDFSGDDLCKESDSTVFDDSKRYSDFILNRIAPETNRKKHLTFSSTLNGLYTGLSRKRC